MAESKIEEKESKSSIRQLKGVGGYVVSALALGMAAFQFYTAYVGPYTPMVQRGIHLAFGLSLAFLIYPAGKNSYRTKVPLSDIFLGALSVFLSLYAVVNFPEADHLRLFSPTVLDKVLGVAAIVLILEMARRATGNALPIVILVFLAYGFFGNYLPGPFGHAGVSFKRMMSTNYMTLDGIWGFSIGASATMIFGLVVFGGTILSLGGNEFMVKAASALFGTSKGGPAKMAVAASALFGTITGSGPANVAATGVFTIPLMKQVGYRPAFAGAVEAVASSGGQIMPPVMGIAAFLIAEVVNISYARVCLYALVPAILYYVAVYVMVHLEAVRLDLKGIPRSEAGESRRVLLEGWNLILSTVTLIFMIGVYESSPQRAALWATAVVIVCDMIKQYRSSHTIDMRRILRAIISGTLQAVIVVTVVGTIGIILSVVNLTGIGIKLSSILVALAHGKLIVLLIICMIASLILGMGMTAVACYVIVAVMAAPALVEMGVVPIAAHLFVFYFGIISAITPPVALASFVAAMIAGSPPMKTSFESFRLGLAAFILPFMFVYNPALLLQGSAGNVTMEVLTALIGIVVLAISLQGVFFNASKLSMISRGFLFVAAISLIRGGLLFNTLGLVLAAIGLKDQVRSMIKAKGPLETPTTNGMGGNHE